MGKEYYCGICEKKSSQKSHHEAHLLSEGHKDKREILRLRMDKKQYFDTTTGKKKKGKEKGEHIENILDKKGNQIIEVNESTECQKYERTDTLVSELTDEEKIKQKGEEEFKIIFKQFLDKCHNILRSGASVVGTDALDDIVNTLLIIHLDGKITSDDDIYNLANIDKSYYRNRVEKNKVKEYIECISVSYLIDNVAELRHSDKMDCIKKIGYILTKHPTTKGIIKNDNFINCKDSNTFAKLLKHIHDFSTEHNIFQFNDLIGLAYEYFVNDYSDGGGGAEGQFFTERPLMNMSFKLIEEEDIKDLGIDGNSSIGDEFCGTFGYPINLKEYLSKTFNIDIQDKNIYGVEQNERLSRYAKLNAMLSLKNSKNVGQGDSFITNVSPHLDIGVYNVPFGKDSIYETKKELYSKTDGLPDFNKIFKKGGPLAVMASQLAFFKVKKMGLCIIKDGEETSSDKHKVYRKFLCDNYVIKKIMKIPQGTFSSTGTATVCIYFIKKEGKSTENIQFLQLNKECSQLHEICKINLNDLKQNNYSWDPNAYLVDEKMKELMETSKCQYIRLGNLVNDISTTKTIPNKEIKEGIYDYYSCSRNSFKNDQYHYEGEYLIHGSRGSTISESVFYINGKFSLGTSVFLSSPKENYNIKYIYYYLKINHVKIFNSIITGGSIPMISKKTYYDILIPTPKIEIQTKCVEQLNDLSNQKEMINSMKDGIKRRMKYFIESQIQKSVNDNNVDFKTIKEICNINNGERVTKGKDHIDNGLYYVYGGGDKTEKFKVNKFNREGFNCKISKYGASSKNFISIINDKFWLHDNGFTIKSNNENILLTEYLAYFMVLILRTEENYKRLNLGAPPKLSMNIFYELMVPIPTLEIQESITQKMNELSDKIKNLDNDIVFIDNLMKEIMQSTYQ